jgi:surface protein
MLFNFYYKINCYIPHKFNKPLNNWDIGNVTDMYCMFYDCTNFNQPLNNWNIRNVKNMDKIFEGCTNINLINETK